VSHPYFVIPRFVATMSMGAISDSRARFRNEKHSMSSIWTSSIKSTCHTQKNTYISLVQLQTQQLHHTAVSMSTQQNFH